MIYQSSYVEEFQVQSQEWSEFLDPKYKSMFSYILRNAFIGIYQDKVTVCKSSNPAV